MANGFAAKDATGATVEVLSKEVAHAALGITGQEQLLILADGVSGQNLAAVDSGNALKVNQKQPSSVAQTNVTSAVTAGSLIASNGSRIAVGIYNDSSANLFVSLSGTASTTNFWVKLSPGAYIETTFTGAISGIWDLANGAARISEFT